MPDDAPVSTIEEETSECIDRKTVPRGRTGHVA